MIKYANINISIWGVQRAICDSCQKDLELRFGGERAPEKIENYKGLVLKYWFGYGSPRDGDTWTAIICENCIESKFDNLIKFDKQSLF